MELLFEKKNHKFLIFINGYFHLKSLQCLVFDEFFWERKIHIKLDEYISIWFN